MAEEAQKVITLVFDLSHMRLMIDIYKGRVKMASRSLNVLKTVQ